MDILFDRGISYGKKPNPQTVTAPPEPAEPAEHDAGKKPVRRIGIAKGMKLYADDYDIVGPDPEILEMFEELYT